MTTPSSPLSDAELPMDDHAVRSWAVIAGIAAGQSPAYDALRAMALELLALRAENAELRGFNAELIAVRDGLIAMAEDGTAIDEHMGGGGR